NFNGNTFAKKALEAGAKYVVIDEKEYYQSKHTILVENVLESLQKLANYHRNYLKLPIIALTGSNGKTTTKELIHAALSQKYKTVATLGNLNNHIGVPLTLLTMDKETELGIVEMGANHPKEIAFLCEIAQPDYGYITNFGKAHLEGFGSLEGVVNAKCELYDYLKQNNKYIFLNADDAKQLEKLKTYIKKIGFSKNKTDYYKIELLDTNPFVKLQVEQTIINSNLIGDYNFSNLGAATIIAEYFNVPLEKIKNGIENYIPQNNRSQIINKNTNKIILDAYNANPSSMEAAISNFNLLKEKNKIVILGDMFELGTEAEKEHQQIASFANNASFQNIYLIGENFFKTNTISSNIKCFKNFDSFKNQFKVPSNSTLLIKGSRGMALERILDLL
ncbi:MAG: UDP-N-acetylmuramoyl-tripeptide--D-alanyl-D-alanine ligase, partial [Oceanihabitans sp.]